MGRSAGGLRRGDRTVWLSRVFVRQTRIVGGELRRVRPLRGIRRVVARGRAQLVHGGDVTCATERGERVPGLISPRSREQARSGRPHDRRATAQRDAWDPPLACLGGDWEAEKVLPEDVWPVMTGVHATAATEQTSRCEARSRAMVSATGKLFISRLPECLAL